MPRSLSTPLYVIRGDRKALPPFSFCKRVPDLRRREKEASEYKKGYEIRISVKDAGEADIFKTILRKRGITSGNPYKKYKRIILPLYGEKNANAFIAVISNA
jgi:hypothetical protein